MELPRQGELLADKYRIGATLGSGGFGKVVRAEDVTTGRPVAIKLLKPNVASLTTSKRFLREMRAIAQLQSPHTLTLFDYGRTSSGLLYMVTELVDGYDLSELLVRRQQLSPGDTVHILLQILYSLREAHQQGLIHRDIKPANIRLFRLDEDPHRVKVLDFGLARSFEDDTARVTKTGHVIGTPRYMSPEQLNGLDLSPSTDIYSAGLVALEMLEGRESLMTKAHAPNPIRVDRADAPPQLASIIAQMVERAPDRRYPNAEAVVRELRPLRRSFAKQPGPQAVPQARGDLRERLQQMDAPRSRRSAVIASVVLVTSVAVALFFLGSSGPEPPATSSTRVLPPALVATPEAGEKLPAAEKSEAVDPQSLALCEGRPPPFHGAGQLKRRGVFGGKQQAFVPPGYDGHRPFGLIVHHLRTDDRMAKATGNTKTMHAPAEVELVEELAKELNLIVLAMALEPDNSLLVHDAVDAAAENLCVDTERLWVFSARSDFTMLNSLWCERSMSGLISVGSGTLVTLPGTTSSSIRKPPKRCGGARFHIRHPGGSILDLSRSSLPKGPGITVNSATWQAWLQSNRCGGEPHRTMKRDSLECVTWACDKVTEHCESPPKSRRVSFASNPAYAPAIVSFVRRAEKSSD